MEGDSKIIRWGILGCGKIAHKFAQDLLTIPNAKLEAVASRNQQRSRVFGMRYHSDKCYDSYVELCLDTAIDVIYIATPHVFHYEQTLMCLNHKKAVLCEKPFAMNTTQVAEMVAAAKRNNVFLMEAMWTLFLPHYQYVLNLIQSKELGEITNLKADFGYDFEFDPTSRVFDKKLGGGSLLDIGIYPLYLAIDLFGLPTGITGQCCKLPTGVDGYGDVLLNYISPEKGDDQEGLQAHISYSKLSNGSNVCEIQGEKGYLMWQHSSLFNEVSLHLNDGSCQTLTLEQTDNRMTYELSHFIDLVESGQGESSVNSWQLSQQVLSVIEQARKQQGIIYPADQAAN